LTDWQPDPYIVLLIITQFSRLEHALAKNDVAGNEIIKVIGKNLKLSENEAQKEVTEVRKR